MLSHNFGTSGHAGCQRLVCRDGLGTWQIALVVGPFPTEESAAAFEEDAARRTTTLVSEEHTDAYMLHVAAAARDFSPRVECYTRRQCPTPGEEWQLLDTADTSLAHLYRTMYLRRCEQRGIVEVEPLV